MANAFYALVPIVIASVYFFGWRSLALLVIVNIAGFLTEYAFCRVYRQPVSSAVFVTNFLFALSLPPTLPLWMAAVGVIFGLTFGKMVFGGFGRNVFNPALVGRAFIYVAFPNHTNAFWSDPFRGFPAGFAHFAGDAITGATPMTILKQGGEIPLVDLVAGFTGGSLGETCGILILLGGLYILWKKSADYRIVISGFVGFLLLQWIVWATGTQGALAPVPALFSGSFLFGLFFFITEPVSASQTNIGKWIYGFLFGALVVIIRTFSVWREGTMFAVLLANVFAPIMDLAIREIQAKRKAASR
ncbi:RnfABCDGE type electron transport complex subunit D [Candidatus Sumerlaeota bacterium]|nr:RnfABCDGE type electron transport complex subunit D [Candidatus Sumerlaeota bacterium]